MRESLLSDAVARSRSLSTHLDPTEDVSPPPEFDPDEFFAAWRDAFDSDEEFRERLDLSDHTVESARARFEVADEARTDDSAETIPLEFETAEQVVDRAVSADSEAVRPLHERREESPFVHLVAPLVVGVSDGIDLETEFAPAAVEALEDWLFERLTKVFQHPLFILFKAHQQVEHPDAEFADATDSTAVYEEFVAAHRDYEAVFEEYPVLLRLLGVVAEQWRGMVRRLDDRVAADRADLARAFADGADLGSVANVETLSNDPHGEGEIVLGVHFEHDCSVVYKPRSVSGEAAFGELLDWTNARAEIPDLYAPDVLDRGEYGWMEYVSHRACDSEAAVERYYERMGGLTALAFALGSRDFHHENLVAAGEQPVVVDQETALSPRHDASNAGSTTPSSLLGDSVLDTLLVPFAQRTRGGDGELVTSGLGDVADEERETKRPNFRHPNTDAMDLTFDAIHRFDGRNLPEFDGATREAAEYLDALKRGFREAATAVVAHRKDFLDPTGPLAAFEGAEIRYLFRPTGRYASKLAESRYASRLRSGLRRSLTFESLYGDAIPATDDRDSSRLVRAETAALRRATVPRFTVEATGRELRDGRENSLGALVDESPVAHARRRISELDDRDVEAQLRLFDLAFTDAKVSEPVSDASDDRERAAWRAGSPKAVVTNVAELLAETATRTTDGALRWAEPARSSPTDGLLVQEPTPELYEGYAGVGLFLAAAAAIRDDDELAARSRRVLRSARLAFENGETDGLGIGGTTGKGSVAYGLVTAGELLDDSDLVVHARAVARRTTEAEIASDATLDVMAGSAGELLAQLAVHRRTGDEAALERARCCGDRLLEATTETAEGYRIPEGEDVERRFAFAHGVGGMGYALVKLADVTGDDAYAQVGRDALRFDAELWRRETDSDAAGSPDGDDETTIWGWCNGLAGVGTSRVALADATNAAGVEDWTVLREDLQAEPSLEDSLCCGSAGRALFMLDAGEVFEDSSLAERGEQLFADALDRARREGRFRLANHLPTLPKFGLFTGLSGVGYVALQLEAREAGVELPNVTRLE
jgi:type 2 lantibiotic biosynthesis protein LanM